MWSESFFNENFQIQIFFRTIVGLKVCLLKGGWRNLVSSLSTVPAAIFLFELSHFIMFDGQEQRICFMNRAAVCQAASHPLLQLADWFRCEFPLRVTFSRQTTQTFPLPSISPCSLFPPCPVSIFHSHALLFPWAHAPYWLQPWWRTPKSR